MSVSTVLIVMWFAVSQAPYRDTIYYPQIAMQEFGDQAACERAAKVIQESFGSKSRVTTSCVPRR